MNIILIFIWIYLAFIAMAFWESSVEGRNAWDKGKIGWKISLKKYSITRYHFYLFFIMLPLLLTLPLIIYSWNLKLLGILITAYFSGLVIEDFVWFLVNPVVKFSEFNSTFASYYPWLKIKKFEIPVFYILAILISLLSWFFIWK